MSEWQPIETAPKDRTCVLLWVDNAYGFDHVKTGLFSSDGTAYSVFDDGDALGYIEEECATHWMPLPEPPKP